MEKEDQLKKKWYKNKKIVAIVTATLIVLIIVVALIAGMGMPMFRDFSNKTSQAKISLKGWGVESNALVKIYLNSQLTQEIKADSKGEFDAELNLKEGKNNFYAIATYKGKEIKGADKEIEYIIEKPNEEKIQESKQDAEQVSTGFAESDLQEGNMEVKQSSAEVVVESKTVEAQQELPAVNQETVTNNVTKAITRNEIMNLFPELKFIKGAPAKGEENYIAKSKEGLVLIQIIGPSDKLTEISMVTTMDPKSIDQLPKLEEYRSKIINKITPSLADYYATQIIDDGDKKTADGYNVTYKYLSLGGGTYTQALIFESEK